MRLVFLWRICYFNSGIIFQTSYSHVKQAAFVHPLFFAGLLSHCSDYAVGQAFHSIAFYVSLWSFFLCFSLFHSQLCPQPSFGLSKGGLSEWEKLHSWRRLPQLPRSDLWPLKQFGQGVGTQLKMSHVARTYSPSRLPCGSCPTWPQWQATSTEHRASTD